MTDARGGEERLGVPRLVAALADAASAVSAVDRALSGFQRGAQADDTAVLALDLAPGST